MPNKNFDYTSYMDKVNQYCYYPMGNIADNQLYGFICNNNHGKECLDPAGYTHLYNKALELEDLWNMMDGREARYTEGLNISNPYDTFARVIFCCDAMLRGDLSPRDKDQITYIRDTAATELDSLQKSNPIRNYFKEEKDYLHELRDILSRYDDFGMLKESDDFVKSTLNQIKATNPEINELYDKGLSKIDEFHLAVQQNAFDLMQKARLAGLALVKEAYIRKALHQLMDTMIDNTDEIEYSFTGSTMKKKFHPMQEGVHASSRPTYQDGDDILLHLHPNETPLSRTLKTDGQGKLYTAGDFGHVIAYRRPILAITPSGEIYYSISELIEFGENHVKNGGTRFGQVYLGNIRDFEF
ncbi:MAG: hypothetical protein HUK20_10380 [Fibrobacter sp.]|nr:hypothetical protein [Fibrobacter sp.]